MTIIRIGLDTAKHVFQLHGVDEREQPVLRRRLGRKEVERFFTKLAPTRIGLEACGAAHYWARVLRGLGHAVVLLPPQYIKPYLKRGKNDALDAGERFFTARSGEAGRRPAAGVALARLASAPAFRSSRRQTPRRTRGKVALARSSPRWTCQRS